jgi:hypothetical protein
MNVVRQSIRISEDGQIQTDMSDKIFWDGVVANAAAVLEPAKVSDPFLRDYPCIITYRFDVYRLYRRLSPLTKPVLPQPCRV